MGYTLKRLQVKTRDWKVNFQDRTKGQRKEWTIPKTEYRNLGLWETMTREEAYNQVQKLNADLKLKRLEVTKRNLKDRVTEKELRLDSCFNRVLLAQFELLFVKGKDVFVWRIAKELISTCGLKSTMWSFSKEYFYSQFAKRGYSYSYSQKIIILINKWGLFVAKNEGTFYEAIPTPTGHHRERLIDAYEAKTVPKVSKPLTPALLESKKSTLSLENYNWLKLSLWFGLRPMEVDKLALNPSGVTYNLTPGVLWVYQSKLVGIPRSKRIKPIPIKYVDQEECLEIIALKALRRPLNKVLRRVFGERYTCYSGRKGFTDLMLEKGNTLEAISQWLGHTNIQRTWQSYKDKEKVLVK